MVVYFWTKSFFRDQLETNSYYVWVRIFPKDILRTKKKKQWSTTVTALCCKINFLHMELQSL